MVKQLIDEALRLEDLLVSTFLTDYEKLEAAHNLAGVYSCCLNEYCDSSSHALTEYISLVKEFLIGRGVTA